MEADARGGSEMVAALEFHRGRGEGGRVGCAVHVGAEKGMEGARYGR